MTRDRGIYRRLLNYLRPHWPVAACAVLGYLFHAAFGALLIDLLQLLLDSVAGTLAESKSFLSQQVLYLFGANPTESSLFRVLLPAWLVVITAARGLGLFAGIWSLGWLSRQLVHLLRCEMFDHLLHSPRQLMHARAHGGEQVSTFIYKAEQTAGVVSNALTLILREGLFVIAIMAYLLYLNWSLALLFLVVMPVIALVVRRGAQIFRRYARRIQDSVGEIAQSAQNIARCCREILIFGGVEAENHRFVEASDYNRRQQQKLIAVNAIMSPMIQCILSLAVAMLIFLILSPTMLQEFTTGQLVAFVTAVIMVAKPARQLMQVVPILQGAHVAASDIFALIDSPGEPDRGHFSIARARGKVELQGLNFAYDPNGEPTLADIDLVAEPGQTIALVGRTGAGKSTLLDLLARFLRPLQGKILLDGVDMQDWQLRSLRRQLALVPQHPVCFDDTVMANIACGEMAGADRSRVLDAANAAQVMEFAERLPQGLDTRIGKGGVQLSGGQIQRIAIARALLKGAPVVLFDEVTTALDAETGHLVRQALKSLLHDHTTFVIAHQLETVEHADRIVVLERGRIAESGSHRELLAAGQLYAQLYRQGLAD